MTPTNATSDAPPARPVEEKTSPVEDRSWAEYPWDGLSDENGPIPAFGPVTTDKHGRIVMSQEEQEARRAAVIRMLAVVHDITDESDTDEVWDEVDRALGESR